MSRDRFNAIVEDLWQARCEWHRLNKENGRVMDIVTAYERVRQLALALVAIGS